MDQFNPNSLDCVDIVWFELSNVNGAFNGFGLWSDKDDIQDKIETSRLCDNSTFLA